MTTQANERNVHVLSTTHALHHSFLYVQPAVTHSIAKLNPNQFLFYFYIQTKWEMFQHLKVHQVCIPPSR